MAHPPAAADPAPQDLMLGIIGGSGLGARLTDSGWLVDCTAAKPDTPFGPPSGEIMIGTVRPADATADGPPLRVALLARHGEGHLLNPHEVPYRANIYALKLLGVTHIVASGATGSLRDHIHPGEIVLVDQLIDRTQGRPRTFFDHAAVHVEFADPCCPVMRRWLLNAAPAAGVRVHARGTYVCMEGPAFSTRAESDLHRMWGGDVIGMTALPEAKLAREAEIAYALLALPTDYDCWRTATEQDGDQHDRASRQSLLQEIIGNLERATEASLNLLAAAISNVSHLREHRSPAADALQLAIWSDRKKIPPSEVKRLRPLWGRYFG